MSSTSVRPVLRSALVLGAAVALLAIPGCGGDDGDGTAGATETPVVTTATATTPADASATSPVGATPAPTTKPKYDGTGDIAPDGTPYRTFTAAQAKRLSDFPESKATARASSTRAIPAATTNREAEAITASLQKSGMAPQKGKSDAADGTVRGIDAGRIRVLFYADERKAAVFARGFQQLVALRPGFARVDRRGAHVWLYIKPRVKLTDADISSYRKVRDRAEQAV